MSANPPTPFRTLVANAYANQLAARRHVIDRATRVLATAQQVSRDLHDLVTTTLNDDSLDLAVIPDLRDLADALASIDAQWRAACGDVQAEWDRAVGGQDERGPAAVVHDNDDYGADGDRHSSRVRIARSTAHDAVDAPPAPPTDDAHGHPLARPQRRLARPVPRSTLRPSPAPAITPPPPASPRRLRNGKRLVRDAETDSSDEENDKDDAVGEDLIA
ncbi:hypothetical protein GGF32_005024 [Allomyces javanicus]|nr:hypothetical protein GGF32_005024 [Allomyces javanicus]